MRSLVSILGFRSVAGWLLVAGVLVLFWRYTKPARRVDVDGVVQIRFWNGFTGADGAAMIRLVEEFNYRNPDVRVIVQRMAWTTYYNKLFVAGLGERSPEVFVLHATMVPRFRQAGFLAPLEVEPGLIDDFDETLLRAVYDDGLLWGLPLDIHPIALFCNRELFRAAGLTNAVGRIAVPQNRTEFMEAARRLTQDNDSDRRPDQWGVVLTTPRMVWQSLAMQEGGRLVSNDGKTCVVDCQENVDALCFLADLVEEEICPKPQGAMSSAIFLQGRAGMLFNGVWMLPQLRKSGIDFESAAFPTFGNQPGVWADSHVLCLNHNLPPRRHEASQRFLRFLSDNSLDWATNGMIPVRKSLRKTAAFESMVDQGAIAERLPYMHYSPMVQYKLMLEQELDLAVERALHGSAWPRDALESATRNIQRTIDRGGRP